jgi:hypothetical protein
VAAFAECPSQHEISISPAVKSIKEYAFMSCSRLRTINLGERLEMNEE